MSRPRKSTVDYFPHTVSHGKTMFIIESTWGNDGYAVWFKLLERIGSSDNHYLDLRDSSEVDFTAAYCRVSTDTLIAIIDKCADINAVDRDLWRHKLVYSQNFVDGVADAYRRRKEKLPSVESVYLAAGVVIDGINEVGEGLLTAETPLKDQSDGNNPQRERERERDIKEKKRKEKKTKTPIPQNFIISDRVRKWASEKKLNHLDEHLESFVAKCIAHDYRYVDWDAAFMEAIRGNWAKIDNKTTAEKKEPWEV